jgi:hypothetical protein
MKNDSSHVEKKIDEDVIKSSGLLDAYERILSVTQISSERFAKMDCQQAMCSNLQHSRLRDLRRKRKPKK